MNQLTKSQSPKNILRLLNKYNGFSQFSRAYFKLTFALFYRTKPYETSRHSPFCILCKFDQNPQLAKSNQLFEKSVFECKFPKVTNVKSAKVDSKSVRFFLNYSMQLRFLRSGPFTSEQANIIIRFGTAATFIKAPRWQLHRGAILMNTRASIAYSYISVASVSLTGRVS